MQEISNRILVIDDETSILKSLERLLRKEPYQLFTTASPKEALAEVQKQSYALVISDQRMPEIEGAKLLENVKTISPDTVRIILTGYTDIQGAMAAINRGSVWRFLTKPWEDDEIKQTIQQAISHYRLIKEYAWLQDLTQKQNIELKDLNVNLEKKVEERTQAIVLLNRKLEQSFIESVRMLAELAEMHSPMIGNHAKRVAALSKAIATQMGLAGKDLFEVELAAILHDIGKIGIPSEILIKMPSSLNTHEYEFYKKHVIKGETLIKKITGIGNVPQFIRHHHEQNDGRGFPDRLSREKIPLPSRIIAVADSYDNLLNSRKGFESATTENVLKYIRQQTPAKFDPEVVASLLQCLNSHKKDMIDDIEVEIQPKDLIPGMCLSRDVLSLRGTLLLPKNTGIKPEHIARILSYHETDPIMGSIYIYRRKNSCDPT